MLRNIKNSQFILVGGKGGVGKTTTASSIAIAMAKRGKKVLVFSADPVHALPDTLNREIGDCVKAVKGIKNLFALQLNPERLLQEYIQKHREVLMKIAEEGTYFDRRDIEQFLTLSLPGLDELMAIMKIMDLQKEHEFDHYILDTAPTGHTIRLLQLPSAMENWLRVLSKMKQKSTYIKSVLVGRYVKDEADRFLEEENARVKALQRLLTDEKRTQFIPVTIPEAMALEETQDLLETLKTSGIHVKNIVINNVIPPTNCKTCSTRRREQLKYIKKIKKANPNYNFTIVPLFPQSIKGFNNLTKFGEHLFKTKPTAKYTNTKTTTSQIAVKKSNFLDLLDPHKELLIFGGKGGVGKTTCATATGLTLAKNKKAMIFSTDPAHSLSDSFTRKIGNKVTHVTDGLYALEMNAQELMQELKDSYRKEINTVFETLFGKLRLQGIHMDIAFDREILEDLFSLIPPGLDEVMALKKIIDLRKEGKYDIFILDTAPTTHALRFLEMPNLAKEWLEAFNNIQYKYSGVVSLEKSTELLERLQEDIEKIRLSLMDSKKTEFVVVTLPEAVPVDETERLVKRLSDIGIPMGHMVVNRVVPPSKCEFCQARIVEQQKHLQQIYTRFANFKIREIPQFDSEIKGTKNLEKYARFLYAPEDFKTD